MGKKSVVRRNNLAKFDTAVRYKKFSMLFPPILPPSNKNYPIKLKARN